MHEQTELLFHLVCVNLNPWYLIKNACWVTFHSIQNMLTFQNVWLFADVSTAVGKTALRSCFLHISGPSWPENKSTFHFSAITRAICSTCGFPRIFRWNNCPKISARVVKEQVTSAMSTGQQRVNKSIWTGLTGVAQYGINEWYEKPFPLWWPCGVTYKVSSQRTSTGL